MKKLLGIMGASILLIGCGSKTVYVTETTVSVDTQPAPMQTTTDEDLYLSVITSEYPQLNTLGDSYLLNLGYTMCNAIDEGMTLVDFGLMVIGMGIDEYMMGYIGGAAIQAFCPWNSDFFNY